ncbi:CLUMA_CG018396, isoform A [Clunio marinus]|uniref:CLUMA_CG018396, isoform A n=1 Tax=Clunio marinus TaxID=568069 RepID=A0A1J1J254_9DIPT|nr:CLUMA_CG018396, isoform A [Clunio marinus]
MIEHLHGGPKSEAEFPTNRSKYHLNEEECITQTIKVFSEKMLRLSEVTSQQDEKEEKEADEERIVKKEILSSRSRKVKIE